ncbi:hypothetical protein [Deinococcus deserti]|uniref:PsbP C-terminal domain-containing protein n=1 Tax=Deinococcus deserti (strain DSM 17065 / CIP 109153 / LMG 22923 / VCD115) TaxID=546414 RepID=C1CW88_DEIDV|nr:hypothetical protein [Deinococcus deserti]ACO46455.1 Conserved hypothetical protein, precursor [Deinococcus deserti VCD115]
MRACRLFFPALLLTMSASAQTLTPFKDAKLPFTVSLPKGWLGVKFEDGASGVSLVSGQKPPATLMRLLFVNKGGMAVTPQQEFQKFEGGIKGGGMTLKQTASREVKYGGVGGLEREYLLSHPKGKVQMRVWYGNGAKNLYSFQLTDSPARYAQASALFSKVLATVKFK